MITGTVLDSLIYLYLGYHFFWGFKKGLIKVLVDLFGIYGACLIAWLFQDPIFYYFKSVTRLDVVIPGSVIFLIIWLVSYSIIYVTGQFLTSLFKISGVHFFMRIFGAAINITKGLVILVVLLSIVDSVNFKLYEPTDSSRFLVSLGSMVINRYNDGLDEDAILPIQSDFNLESSKIIDDFQNSILEQ